MSEAIQNPNDATSQFQLETFDKLADNLKGFNKLVVKKILNSSFAEDAKKITANYGAKAAKDALMKLVNTTIQNAANAIRLKIAVILIIIVGIFAVLAIIGTTAVGGNIMIPIVVSIIPIAIIWFVTGIMSKLIARRASDTIFKAVESRI